MKITLTNVEFDGWDTAVEVIGPLQEMSVTNTRFSRGRRGIVINGDGPQPAIKQPSVLKHMASGVAGGVLVAAITKATGLS